MSQLLPFGSNTLSLFQYEPFSYTWTDPSASSIAKSLTSAIPAGTVTDLSSTAVQFASATGLNVTSSNESITLTSLLDPSAIVLATSFNAITIGRARFVDDVSASLSNRSFTFYKNEPITPTVFSSAFPLSSAPVATPTLPAGLGFLSNAPTRYSLAGTPLVQSPSTSYNIIGSNPPKYIPSCPITIAVQGERLVLDLSGTGIVSGMQVGTPIQAQALFARCPPYPRSGANLGNIRYTWTTLPDGLEFADGSGNTRTSPFVPTDASATLVLRGTPTAAGAQQFVSAGLSQATVAVTATRFAPLPVLSNTQSFTLSFGETVLFDTISLSNFYSNVQIDPSSQFVRAQTYFTSSPVPIASIVSTNLRSDISLNFVAGTGRAYFTGTPFSNDSASYTFRARNANGFTRDVSAVVTVVSDSITITGPQDVCYNFVRSRPVSNALTGYYPAPITWTATAASQRPVSFAATALAGTGIDLSTSAATATLTGTPTAVTSLRNLRLDVSAVGSPATAYADVSFAVIADQFTFTQDPSTTPIFVQNKPATPVRFLASTLSGNAVASYSSSNLVSGLTLTNFGVLQGTPLDASLTATSTIVASTGLGTGSNSFSYTVLPDEILFLATPNPGLYKELDPVSIQITGLTYTGSNASNYTLVDLSSTVYGLSINSTTGLLSGTLPSNIPQGIQSFSVTAQTGTRVDTLPASFQMSLLDATIGFSINLSGGPTVTSPTQRSFTLYQYVPITPIQFSATGTGTVRYYLRTADLPPGLFFDALTGRLMGKSVERGTVSLTVYARDDVGVTAIPITLTTIFPLIVRDGVTAASAYTSLLRQYTAVNAARNAENNEVYPTESRPIGAFARPYPPDETTATIDPKCRNPEC